MSIHPSQQTLGYLLIALGLFVAIAGYISFRKGGRMKVITYVVFVLASIGLGIKFAAEPEKTPMEMKQVSLPRTLVASRRSAPGTPCRSWVAVREGQPAQLNPDRCLWGCVITRCGKLLAALRLSFSRHVYLPGLSAVTKLPWDACRKLVFAAIQMLAVILTNNL